MEKELNIAEILKDKPNGTKLYANAFGELTFERIKNIEGASIYTRGIVFKDLTFYSDGKYTKYGEPILVPSKEMRDWSKFAWKRGDVLLSNDGCVEVIFDKWYDDTYTSFYCKHYLDSEDANNIRYLEAFICVTEKYSLEDEESLQCYISTIEKRLGGKLNLKTLEIEKSKPEFKDGDIVVTDAIPSLCYSKCIFILKGNLNVGESQASSYVFYNVENNHVDFDILDTRIRDRNIHLATDEEGVELFDALTRKGKYWNAEKKVIEDIEKKYPFKPFEKVLVRNPNKTWMPELFGYKYGRFYICVGGLAWEQCISYKGNEHLLGTTEE